MSRLTVTVKSIGLAAEGLSNWQQAISVLSGEQPYQPEEMPRYAPNLLPPNERRRATQIGRLAFQSAEEAIGRINGAASELASVFACSGGDTYIVSSICSALATDERLVSPTLFHNSVHNAPSGYWSIATQSHGASTSLSAFDGSFVMGLLEAVTLACCEGQDVLLVSYDGPVSAPLDAKRPVHRPFTSAMVLSTEAQGASYLLHIDTRSPAPLSKMENPELEALRLDNPSARALPLLSLMARQQPGTVVLPGMEGFNIAVTVEALE